MTDEITLDAPETRIERFLAAAAGVEGITLDEPETRIERYLYMIAQGSGGVPKVEDSDKGKYLHTNESTGDLEWATAGGSGGGVLFVHVHNAGGTLDKTWQEIHDASANSVVIMEVMGNISYLTGAYNPLPPITTAYSVGFFDPSVMQTMEYSTESASGYPTSRV